MATFLYNLGRWCAEHTWRVIAGWVVVLVAFAGAASLWGNPLTTKITMPGTTFQKVLQELDETIPEAAGGFGTVVFESTTGQFTTEQQQAIADVATQWANIQEVSAVTNPFEVQASIDSASAELRTGEQQLAGAQAQLDAAKQQIDAGKAQLEPVKQQLAQLTAANPTDPRIGPLTARIEAVEAQLAPGITEYEKGLATLENSKKELAAGKALQEATSGVKFISDNGQYAVAQIQFTEDPRNLTKDIRDRIPALGTALQEHNITAHYSAEIAQSMDLMGVGEIIGLAIAALVLIVMLGTLVAAGLPLVMALVGVGVGLAGAMAATALFDMNSMTPSLALMLGLAVGIDYTLFIINRHRTHLLTGMSIPESIGRAIGTAGSAVIFAGLTVVIALAALVLSGIPILHQMGLVAAWTVAITVVVSVTLTPALLGLVGTRVMLRRTWRKAGIEDPTAPHTVDPHHEPAEHGGWYVKAATKYPWLTVAGVVALIAIAAFPVTELRLGLPDGGSEPKDSTAFKAYTAVGEHFGPGVNGPIVAMATLKEKPQSLPAKQAAIVEEFKDVDGVVSAVPFGVSKDGTTLAFQIIPTTGPAEAETVATIQRLREASDNIESDTGATIGLTGQTVANIEISDQLKTALPPYLLVVVGLSLLILTGVFRSIVVPIIATAGFLLSIAAAFGAMVAVYQWGWLANIFDVGQPGPVMSFAPIIVIGVLFGLAMDYQMFLVTGMRESYVHGESARRAVKTGFMHGAKVVTAAAIIMFAVFGGFVFAHMTMVRPIGFGLAVGVLVDAVIVRMTLTPALMHILGEKAWFMPKALDKITPELDVEGAKLANTLDRVN